MSSRIAALEPWLQPYARYMLSIYRGARVTSTRRSYSEQLRLWRRYVNGQSTYPAAPPGYSMHEYGRAWDMVAPGWALEQLGAIWEQIGGTWGGRGGDPIHFEA